MLKSKIERDNPDDFYWSDYAKLVEKSYDIIRLRSPKTKIAIGSIGGGSVALDGFHGPVLKYLAGKINEKGGIIEGSKSAEDPAVLMFLITMIFPDIRNIKEGRFVSQEIVSVRLSKLKNPQKYKKTFERQRILRQEIGSSTRRNIYRTR